MRGMRFINAVAVLAWLAGWTAGCQPKTWQTHAAVEPTKPASPLRAGGEAALLVVTFVDAEKSSDIGFTVFEADASVVAQFPLTMAGWSTANVSPGLHRFYVRTWNSYLCRRVDAKLEAAKVYVFVLDPNIVGGVGGEFVLAAPGRNPGGPLHAFPFVKLDSRAARAEVELHREEMQECIGRADAFFALHSTPAHEGGFDEIRFSVEK